MFQTRLSAKLVLFGGLFLLFDQLLKFLARTNPTTSYYLVKPWLGWEYFENTGIAFSLPFPQKFLLIVTPIILLWLYHIISKQKGNKRMLFIAITFIIAGAVSNFIDRLMFGITVDYIRIATAIINLADISIVIGVLLLLTNGEDSKDII